MRKYDIYVKNNITECYLLMKRYLKSEDVESEEAYWEMREKIKERKISIPQEIFVKIENFADEYLEPIVYDHRRIFSECYTEEIGVFDEKDTFNIRDGMLYQFLGNFINKLISIEEELDNFARKELHPLLVQ